MRDVWRHNSGENEFRARIFAHARVKEHPVPLCAETHFSTTTNSEKYSLSWLAAFQPE